MYVTENELKVLKVLYEAEKHFIDIGEPGFSDVDMDSVVGESGLDTKSAKGVLGSLMKKELIQTADVNEDYNIFYLTNKAYEIESLLKS